MIKDGIVSSPRFASNGLKAQIFHGTTTSHYGNLSKKRDQDGTFRIRYQQFVADAGINVKQGLVIPRITHGTSVAVLGSKKKPPTLQYIDRDSIEVQGVFASPGIAPPGMTQEEQLDGFDAILTDSPHLILGMPMADCAPIFVCVPNRGVIGLIHAGFLGFLGGIIENALEVLTKVYNVHPIEITAYIGPCISRASYDVRQSGMWKEILSKHLAPDEAARFDLKTAIITRLHELGLPSVNISASMYCTAKEHTLFYSNAMAQTIEDKQRLGRNLSFIGIRN